MARLSVNLNKIALLRNSRTTGVPNLMSFPALVKSGGGRGITIHPRPDERHIRRADALELANVIAAWRPIFEYNIEGNPTPEFLDLVDRVRPEQCTLVPDAVTAFTSEKGWDLETAEMARLAEPIARLKSFGTRVILFVDPNPAIASLAAKTGADGIEIYTGSYATAYRQGSAQRLLEAIAELGSNALRCGLLVNAGYDLNRDNLRPLMSALPCLHEASIGHELTADALIFGFERSVELYATALRGTGT
jgi:pyridoxine 5-phosphate synthase